MTIALSFKTTNRPKIAIALALGITVLTGCSAGGSEQPNSEVEESSAVTTTEDSSPSAEPDTAEAPAPVTPLTLNASGTLAGNATALEYEPGAADAISAVSTGQFDADSGVMPFVFRNNTSEAISHVDASATIRDPSGSLVATGSSQGTVPAQIPSGGLGLAYIYLEGDVPEGATFEFAFESVAADTSFYNTGDLQVTEVSETADGIIGTATNNTGAKLSGPYSVEVYCFDESGAIVDEMGSYANEDGDIAADGTVSFSLDFYGTACPTYVVGVTGYFS